ncbi:16632_t:CDS:10 [Acaulospora colombiana]|uniref:16632_t:CDS:1 n=1 Tax=Acaulospora colombiana TaxID=27376 RepID=A0ACA9LLP3_9GLOM|nr:16632_t:CDS:10 [Acaulospora colombiana]
MSLPNKDDLAKYFPTSFGKKFKPPVVVDESVEEDGQPDPLRSMLPASFGTQKKKHTAEDIFSKTRRKDDESVTALALDPAGARLITGSSDYDVKFWDFAGMDSSLRPFRTIKPCGDHKIHHIEYSLSGDQFLIISGSAQAKIYDRDGFEIEEYIKGDPYIRDMKNTSGHIASLTCGGWHPSEKQTFITGSTDSTIRIWDVGSKRKQKYVLVHKSKERGGRSAVTAARYSPDSKFIAGVWDIRNFKSPVSQAKDLPVFDPEANVIFSPDEKLIITGTAVKKGEGYGKLVMMDRNSLEIVRTMSITQSSVIRVLWHSRINQIITGSADGSVQVFYDPNTSVRGAKLCVVREPKKRAIDEYEINRPIIAPHSLSLFRDDRPNGPGKGGKIGSSLTEHIMKELIKDTTRDEDPRKALLKFAQVSEDDPQWIGKAYKKTQPNPILADTTGEEEEET